MEYLIIPNSAAKDLLGHAVYFVTRFEFIWSVRYSLSRAGVVPTESPFLLKTSAARRLPLLFSLVTRFLGLVSGSVDALTASG
eukprot:1196234-Prorocentrum_minimum.AAC.1